MSILVYIYDEMKRSSSLIPLLLEIPASAAGGKKLMMVMFFLTNNKIPFYTTSQSILLKINSQTTNIKAKEIHIYITAFK